MRAIRSSVTNGHAGASLLLPAALALPLVLGIVLLVYARRAEEDRRRVAERALGDYAAVAAWQVARHAHEELHRVIMTAFGSCVGMSEFARGDLRASAVLNRIGRLPSSEPRRVFRYVVATGAMEWAGSAPSAQERDGIAAQARLAVDRRSGEPHHLAIVTLAGARRAIALSVASGGELRSAVVYGLVLDPDVLRAVFDAVLEKHSVLPEAIVRRPYPATAIRVHVADNEGKSLFPRATPALEYVAVESLAPIDGGIRVTVSLGQPLAANLLIGGLPPAPVSTLLVLLALAVALSAGALKQHRRARDLASARARFVANVSHELRTPLTHISMFAETLMLERERSADERRQFASVIHREAQRLTGLVEGVLRFARSEAMPPQLELERRDLDDALSSAVATFRPIAAAAMTTVSLHGRTGLLIPFDHRAVQQIMLNLFDNAVKYGPEGQQISVRVAATASEVEVSVDDEGPGIPPADRHRVFDAFVRLDAPRARRATGTGIGLAVVRDLVRGHGGDVRVATSPRGGARISFTLPRAIEDSAVPDETLSSRFVATSS